MPETARGRNSEWWRRRECVCVCGGGEAVLLVGAVGVGVAVLGLLPLVVPRHAERRAEAQDPQPEEVRLPE